MQLCAWKVTSDDLHTVIFQAQTEGRATPTPSTSRSAPQKGIKNGSMVDATQRSVAPELHLIMNGGPAHGDPESTPVSF